MNKRFGWHSGTLTCRNAIIKNDMTIEGDMSFGDASTDTLTVNGTAVFESTTDFDGATTFTPTVVADTSMYPLRITYNYAGATANTGVDMDLYSIRSTITQTSSNDKATLGLRGYMQGIRSDIVLNGFADTAYAFYANVSAAGASTVNGMYGVTSVMNTGSATISLDESGFIAGVRTNISGSGDVTCAGTGYGKLVGFYVSWLHTNALTVDSAGYHIGIKAGATLDSGYRVNSSGTLTNSFHSYNSSGTMTNVIKVDGAHSFFADFDDATTCCVTTESGAATTIKAQILVKTPAGATGYVNVYGTTGT